MFRSTDETMEKLKYPNTIGYFGDSFCANTTRHSWTDILANKLDAKIVNRGKNGSSIWTAILDFENLKNLKKLPDICIFCWTNPHRLYHPSKPLTLNSLHANSNLEDAVRKYFGHLWFNEKEFLNYRYVLEHFDKEILKDVKCKQYQIFSFSPKDANNNFEVNLQNNFINDFSLLNFSGLTLEDHYDNDLQNTLINHMSIEKNIDLANYFYEKIID